MKRLIVLILGLCLLGCNTTQNTAEYSEGSLSPLINQPRVIHEDKLGAKEAVIGIALATTVGVVSKDSFTCTKSCEQALKESLAKNKAK